MLKRLQEKKPNYNVTKWAVEDLERRKILNNICEFPYQIGNKDEQQQPLESEMAYMNGPPDFIIRKNRSSGGTQQPFKKRGYTSDSSGQGNAYRPPRTTQS